MAFAAVAQLQQPRVLLHVLSHKGKFWLQIMQAPLTLLSDFARGC